MFHVFLEECSVHMNPLSVLSQVIKDADEQGFPPGRSRGGVVESSLAGVEWDAAAFILSETRSHIHHRVSDALICTTCYMMYMECQTLFTPHTLYRVPIMENASN